MCGIGAVVQGISIVTATNRLSAAAASHDDEVKSAAGIHQHRTAGETTSTATTARDADASSDVHTKNDVMQNAKDSQAVVAAAHAAAAAAASQEATAIHLAGSKSLRNAAKLQCEAPVIDLGPLLAPRGGRRHRLHCPAEGSSKYDAALDSLPTRTVKIHVPGLPEVGLYLSAAVLHMRGPNPATQPATEACSQNLCCDGGGGSVGDGDGGELPGHGEYGAKNVLLWNGELFGGDFMEGIRDNTQTNSDPGSCSDTTVILRAFNTALAAVAPCPTNPTKARRDDDHLVTTHARAIYSVLRKVQGPFALMFWDDAARTMWFARDVLGRRSLVQSLTDGAFIVASVGVKASNGASSIGGAKPPTEGVPCGNCGCGCAFRHDMNDVLPGPGLYSLSFQQETHMAVLRHHIPTTGTSLKPFREDHDKLGVHLCLVGGQCPLLQSVLDHREYIISRGDLVSYSDPACEIAAAAMKSAQSRFFEVLSASVRDRVLCLPPRSRSDSLVCGDDGGPTVQRAARVAVLFSGGIDCMVIAALASLHLPAGEPVDLINVVFAGDISEEALPGRTPDRIAAINGLCELREAYPTRPWRLIDVNVRVEDIKAVDYTLRDLLLPLNTVMDFNIACILWFGARGRGIVHVPDRPINVQSNQLRYYSDKKKEMKPSRHNDTADDVSSASSNALHCDTAQPTRTEHVTSQATMVLSGLGADELLGGYGRHRTALRREGPEALARELSRDVSRLWHRNLGRDDRAISDWGRELRLPFLDERVVSLVMQLPVTERCSLADPPGKGDKAILRRMAAQHLKLPLSATLVKRAMQFGTRLANPRLPGAVALPRDVESIINRKMLTKEIE